MTLAEAMAEKAARGEMSPPELQEALALLLRDLLAREGPSGVVAGPQDDVPTRRVDGGGPPGGGRSHP